MTEKLVRNKMPEIIRTHGGVCVVRPAKDRDEYFACLLKKLEEEKQEFVTAHIGGKLEELADIFEVLRAITELHGFDPCQVLSAAQKKREERGGFSERLLMTLEK